MPTYNLRGVDAGGGRRTLSARHWIGNNCVMELVNVLNLDGCPESTPLFECFHRCLLIQFLVGCSPTSSDILIKIPGGCPRHSLASFPHLHATGLEAVVPSGLWKLVANSFYPDVILELSFNTNSVLDAHFRCSCQVGAGDFHFMGRHSARD